MTKKSINSALFTSVMMVLIMTMVYVSTLQNKETESVIPSLLTDVVLNRPEIVSLNNLIDHKNLVLTNDRINDYWTFVFFGYTHCPDVCPATLSQMSQFNERLKEDSDLSEKTQFFFVSVDPDRDTTHILSNFVSFFDSSFTALTGSADDIRLVEDQFGTFHQFEKETAPGEYAVTHSAFVYLINPSGQLAAKFSPPMNLDKVRSQLNLFVELFSKNRKLS